MKMKNWANRTRDLMNRLGYSKGVAMRLAIGALSQYNGQIPSCYILNNYDEYRKINRWCKRIEKLSLLPHVDNHTECRI